MPSGNFLIGKDRLTLKGFNDYLLPKLQKENCKVKNPVELGRPREF